MAMISAPELPGFSRFWTVSEVNTYLKTLLEADRSLQDLWVEGEISNLSRPASGHLYFTLKGSEFFFALRDVEKPSCGGKYAASGRRSC